MSKYQAEYEIKQEDGKVVHACLHIEADDAGDAYDLLLQMIGKRDLRSIRIISAEH